MTAEIQDMRNQQLPNYPTLRQLIMVRHSEAEKTQRQVHGGPGTHLTDRGRTDTVDLARYLSERELVGHDSVVFCGPRQQTLETAEILAHQINLHWSVLEGLRNINMGIFDGLTDDEARATDPDSMARLESWRRGELPVGKICIPRSENLESFVTRIDNTLEEMISVSSTPLVIVTRSVGIALHNLLGDSFRWNFDHYARIRLDPGSVTVYSRNKNPSNQYVLSNSTEYLDGSREFADD